MKSIALTISLFVLAVLPSVASAQDESIEFWVLCDHDHNLLSSSYNDTIAWEIWHEPIVYYDHTEPYAERLAAKGIDDEYIRHATDSCAFIVEQCQGRTVAEFSVDTPGIYHLTVKNSYTGEPIGYAIIVVLKRIFELWGGFDDSFKVWITKPNDPYANWSPYKMFPDDEPDTEGMYPPGLLN